MDVIGLTYNTGVIYISINVGTNYCELITTADYTGLN